MIARRAVMAALAFVACGASTAPAAAPRAFAFDDVYRIVALSSPQLSPDGAHVLVAVRTADREHDRWHRRLDEIDTADGARRTLDVDGDRIGEYRWSPDGTRIAYLDGGAVWIADAGGAVPRRISAEAYEVTQFTWRPDGAAIAFAALARPAPPTGDARYEDAYEVGNDAQLAHGPPRDAHLFVQALDGTPARALGPSGGTVTWGEAESTLSFSPDGTALAYVWAADALPNDAVAARVRVVDPRDGRERKVDVPAGHVRDPLFAPDGAWLAYAHSNGDSQLTPSLALALPLRGGATRVISTAVDRTVRDIAWEPGTATLDFTVRSDARIVLYRAANVQPSAVDLGALSIESGLDGAFARDGSLAFIGDTSQRPGELYVRAPSGTVRQLTDENDALVGELGLAATERMTFPTTVGVRGDAVLTLPAGYRRGQRYPLVVALHGGPTSAATQTFDALDQLFAAHGWLVLEPNYRGSDDRGARYQAAVGGDKLRGPGDDVDAAIAAVRARGMLDGTLAVGGWSYGAGLTLWMIEHRHDWRAAVAGAAVTDIAADYATADDIAADRALVGGSPLVGAHRAAAAAMSPIAYVDRVRTPLLLMTCREDSRVSPAGVYEFYHALRDLGRPVQLVAYPIAGHFPSDPVRRVDVYRRWVAFFEAHRGT
ncbi:MAG TPA: prolyl oligopeptidase family serine peptidase [Candidatus Elarobacter sp.]|jgi:dipeptidyl aminopeptidase/acylaminoacyl peptidase|nr:prolyl oligopeptidase family serine peptidase [Candidatus Elarobacter sp.]